MPLKLRLWYVRARVMVIKKKRGVSVAAERAEAAESPLITGKVMRVENREPAVQRGRRLIKHGEIRAEAGHLGGQLHSACLRACDSTNAAPSAQSAFHSMRDRKLHSPKQETLSQICAPRKCSSSRRCLCVLRGLAWRLPAQSRSARASRRLLLCIYHQRWKLLRARARPTQIRARPLNWNRSLCICLLPEFSDQHLAHALAPHLTWRCIRIRLWENSQIVELWEGNCQTKVDF